MHLIDQFFAPWQDLYSDSTAISTTVTALHLIGMLIGGGLAIAADRATLRIVDEEPGQRERHLGELNAIHRPVLLALGLLFITGIAMVTSDITTFLTSPVLWAKLALVTLLVFNGVVLERTETALRRANETVPALWGRLRFSARCSIALWIATLIIGTVLVSAA
jgi:uncharacterized membrane protein